MLKTKPFTYLKIGSIFLLFTVLACNKHDTSITETDKSKKEAFCLDANFKEKITLAKPVEKKVTKQIHLTGTVEANPDQVIPVISMVDGVIASTYFSLGDHVKKGQVLIDLRSAELSELQSDYKSIEAEIAVGKRQLKAVQSGFEDGISSENELVQAQSGLTVLQAKQENINTVMELYSASKNKGVFQIKAPSSGIITQKNSSNGMQISAHSDALFTVSNLKEVWVLANIHASNIEHIKEDMPVTIKTISYSDKEFQGKINSIAQVFSNESKVLKARIVLPNTDLKLKPGMTVDVNALQDLEISGMSIPTKALVFDNHQNYMIIYKSDCDLQIRPVTILSKSNGEVFITNPFSEDEQLVSENQLLIYEQLKNDQS